MAFSSWVSFNLIDCNALNHFQYFQQDLESDVKALKFTKNGTDLGVAMSLSVNLDDTALFPHIFVKNMEVEVNFGSKVCVNLNLNKVVTAWNCFLCVWESLKENYQGCKPIDNLVTRACIYILYTLSCFNGIHILFLSKDEPWHEKLEDYTFVQDCEEDALQKGPSPPNEKSECEVIFLIKCFYKLSPICCYCFMDNWSSTWRKFRDLLKNVACGVIL